MKAAPLVAILGRKEAFHGTAARGFFGNEVNLLELDSFDSLLQKVKAAEAACGVMAWENLLVGPVPGNQERLRLSGLRATGEVLLSINLHLAGFAGTPLEHIRHVRSHPMALRQAGLFLESHPWMTPEESTDTANAAREVFESKDTSKAAITGSTAASRFGLALLCQNIEDRTGNQTRFLIISRKGAIEEKPERVLFACRPESNISRLAGHLLALSQLGLSLRKLDSLPDPAGNWNYLIHLDFDMQLPDRWPRALALARRKLPGFAFLGAFRAGKLISG